MAKTGKIISCDRYEKSDGKVRIALGDSVFMLLERDVDWSKTGCQEPATSQDVPHEEIKTGKAIVLDDRSIQTYANDAFKKELFDLGLLLESWNQELAQKGAVNELDWKIHLYFRAKNERFSSHFQRLYSQFKTLQGFIKDSVKTCLGPDYVIEEVKLDPRPLKAQISFYYDIANQNRNYFRENLGEATNRNVQIFIAVFWDQKSCEKFFQVAKNEEVRDSVDPELNAWVGEQTESELEGFSDNAFYKDVEILIRGQSIYSERLFFFEKNLMVGLILTKHSEVPDFNIKRKAAELYTLIAKDPNSVLVDKEQ
ncbi:MAG: hypothetical protein H6510_12160 [Acidobacteria bacterium]|nr:hypothetical protein [Acidobacteriota bacterium]MCB9398560.1 hypothetical protein [Acidobacteriota bacterium]